MTGQKWTVEDLILRPFLVIYFYSLLKIYIYYYYFIEIFQRNRLLLIMARCGKNTWVIYLSDSTNNTT